MGCASAWGHFAGGFDAATRRSSGARCLPRTSWAPGAGEKTWRKPSISKFHQKKTTANNQFQMSFVGVQKQKQQQGQSFVGSPGKSKVFLSRHCALKREVKSILIPELC